MIYYKTLPASDGGINYEKLLILRPPDMVIFASRMASGLVVEERKIKLPAGRYKTTADILRASPAGWEKFEGSG